MEAIIFLKLNKEGQMNIKKFIEEFLSIIDIGMSSDINAFLRGDEDILKYEIEADNKKTCIIRIKLKNYNDTSEKNFGKALLALLDIDI